MGWSWDKVPVVAVALAALGGCCDQGGNGNAARLYCHLRPVDSTVTVKGTAEYTLTLNGNAAVEGISYSDGQNLVYVPNPPHPMFSVTVELEAGDMFQSLTDGYITKPGSILASGTFWPADGSEKTSNNQLCWDTLVDY